MVPPIPKSALDSGLSSSKTPCDEPPYFWTDLKPGVHHRPASTAQPSASTPAKKKKKDKSDKSHKSLSKGMHKSLPMSTAAKTLGPVQLSIQLAQPSAQQTSVLEFPPIELLDSPIKAKNKRENT
ncbi:UNVERIFIED_CONTAM: hypothetical protein K2H54_054229, partial [Gekko kuhli]